MDAALADTLAYLSRVTGAAQVLTPQLTINAGALWSEVNMLRVMAHHPQGRAFTNEPGVSSAVVGRDAAWFVYIVSQEDERGLVFCSARDPRGNVWVIARWRNIIPRYTLNGAVTEINAECAAALRAAGHLAENLGQPESEEFFAQCEHQGDHDAPFHVYATAQVASEHTLEVYAEDVTETVRVLNLDVCHVALRRPREAVLLLGNTREGSSIVPVELGAVLGPETTYDVQLYDSESQTWRSGDRDRGAALSTPAVTIEASGFRILRFVEV